MLFLGKSRKECPSIAIHISSQRSSLAGVCVNSFSPFPWLYYRLLKVVFWFLFWLKKVFLKMCFNSIVLLLVLKFFPFVLPTPVEDLLGICFICS